MSHVSRFAPFAVLAVFLTGFMPMRVRADLDYVASSYVGGAADDRLRAAAILSDGSILVAGEVGALALPVEPALVGSATATSPGLVLRLSPDGTTILDAWRTAGPVLDLDTNDRDDAVLALGSEGLVTFAARTLSVRWSATPGHVHRVDIDPSGRVAALVPSNVAGANTTSGTGTVVVYDESGDESSRFSGHRNTLDLSIDGASETIVLVGWRQANAFDGSSTQPVQIAYLRGVALDGTTRWTAYDWSTERESDDFINRTTNNMADTRGYRVTVGADGRLVAAFECAGGNHIFRYAPFDVIESVDIVGGDAHHEFYNTRSEHKTFFGEYEPATGEYVRGQQLTGRLSSGAGNTVRISEGAILTDDAGHVFIGGASAAGLPLTPPEGTGDYTGGAYVVMMDETFTSRLFVTRADPNGHTHAVAARTVSGVFRAVFAGKSGRNREGASQLYTKSAVQTESGGGEDGFFAVFADGVIPPLDTTPLEPPADGGVANDAGTRADLGVVDAAVVDGAAAPSAPTSGCSCNAAPPSPHEHVWSVAFLVAFAWAIRGRRRRGAGHVVTPARFAGISREAAGTMRES